MTGKRVWSYIDQPRGELVLQRITNVPDGPGITVQIHSPRGMVAVYLPDMVARGLGDELIRIATPEVDTDPV